MLILLLFKAIIQINRSIFLMRFTSKVFSVRLVLSILVATLLFQSSSIAQYSDASLRAATAQNIRRDSVAGEDLKIRRAAVAALGKLAGTVVVMNARTGKIYTIVNQRWAVSRGFKPCSTIKLVTGVGGYNEGLIRSNGNLKYGTYRIGLNDSLAYSNNAFFQKVGKSLGNAKMLKYAYMLGLGSPTGINLPGEFEGQLPYGNSNLRIYSHGDDFEVTPLQLAVLVSAVTNGGNLLIPQIPNKKFMKTGFRGYYRDKLKLRRAVYQRVIPGMIGAVGYGTAKTIKLPHMNIGGKTGSCIANGTWVGLFASVAPIRDPRFSVVVILEGKRARGKYAAQVAGKIYKSLGNRLNERYKNPIAKSIPRSMPKPITRTVKTTQLKPLTPIRIPAKRIKTNSKPPVKTTNNGTQTTDYGEARVTVSSEVPIVTGRSKRRNVSPSPSPRPKKPVEKKPETNEQFPPKIIVISRPRVVSN